MMEERFHRKFIREINKNINGEEEAIIINNDRGPHDNIIIFIIQNRYCFLIYSA